MFDIKKRIETLEAEYDALCHRFRGARTVAFMEKDYKVLASLTSQMTEKANLIADWKRELYLWENCKNKEA